MSASIPPNRRILLIDDNPAIHDDFRRVLQRDDSAVRALDAEASALFGARTGEPDTPAVVFELDSAFQGEEGLQRVQAACAAGKPYAMAFVDMRMPPGWDGLTTIKKLWEVDPDLQVVICTAFSDRSWTEIQNTLTARDRWMVVKKPFDQIEVLQLAHALTTKWDLARAASLRLDALEKMVKARTEQLAAALAVNGEFLNNVSHEMLTPMNGVLGMLQLLADTSLDGEQAELVGTATSSAEHLLQLLHQVLAFNDAGSAALQPAETDAEVRSWVARVHRRFVERAREKRLELRLEFAEELPRVVRVPANILAKVLELLVENAVKFTASGSVTVEVGWREGAAPRLVFAITDTGIGLTPEQLEMVRIPFAQVDGSLSRASSGIGIGLPLARRLLGLVGSSLSLESLPGEGTRASFAIPVAVGVLAA